MTKVKELELDIQYIMNVLSARGEQKAFESFENVLKTLGYEATNVRDGAILIPVPELGDTLLTVGQVRSLMSCLDDHDLVVVETCDENGDVEDLYPLSMDIIQSIGLTDGTNVREVRFCQRPHENVKIPIVKCTHGLHIPSYLPENQKTHCRIVCDYCGSDNVQSRAWVRPNKNNEFLDLMSEEVQDNFCVDEDCNCSTSSVEVATCDKVIGFQVWGDTGTAEAGKIHPDMSNENNVYSLNQCNGIMNNNDNDEQWTLKSIWATDIECPVMMFSGDPRD